MMIMHIIFDLMGNDLQKLIYDTSVIEIEMKHLPVRELYTFDEVFLYLNESSVSSNVLYKQNAKLS